MKIIIPGNPIALTRHRHRMLFGKVYQYDPQACEKLKVRDFAIASIKSRALVESCALKVRMLFYVPYLSKMTKTEQNLASWGIYKPKSKPDLDNYVKFYLDCFNGVFYRDDSQIVLIKACKMYSSNPRVEIEIMDNEMEMCGKMCIDVLSTISLSEFDEIYQELFECGNRIHEMGDDMERVAREAAKSLVFISNKYAQKFSKIKKLGIKDATKERQITESDI